MCYLKSSFKGSLQWKKSAWCLKDGGFPVVVSDRGDWQTFVFLNRQFLYRWLYSFVGYSKHPFRNYFHVNPNSYSAWYGMVDRHYPASLLNLITLPPTPFLLSTPPSIGMSVGMVISPSDHILFSLQHRQRTVKQYPNTQKGQTWALESLVTFLRSNLKVSFA
jgi:hypothetical protein